MLKNLALPDVQEKDRQLLAQSVLNLSRIVVGKAFEMLGDNILDDMGFVQIGTRREVRWIFTSKAGRVGIVPSAILGETPPLARIGYTSI